MKRLDIVQLVIIIAGIISALFFIQSVPTFLYYMFVWLTDGLRGGFYLQAFLSSIIYLAAYALITIYAIKNSKLWAEKICDKASFDSDVNFSLNKGELLYSIMIGIGIYGLVKTIPYLLSDLYKFMDKKELALDDSKSSTKEYIFINCCFIIFYIILVVYANVFADFFSKKINNVEPPDSISLKEEN